MKQHIGKAFERLNNMATKEEDIGFEIARLIKETARESIDDLTKILGTKAIILEYVALLLWVAAKEVQTVLQEELCQTTIEAALQGTFFILEGPATRDKITYFNAKMFQDFINNRFELYSAAWNTNRDHVIIACNFILCCFGDAAEYRKIVPNPEDKASQTVWVVDHYLRFSEKVKSVLSRY